MHVTVTLTTLCNTAREAPDPPERMLKRKPTVKNIARYIAGDPPGAKYRWGMIAYVGDEHVGNLYLQMRTDCLNGLAAAGLKQWQGPTKKYTQMTFEQLAQTDASAVIRDMYPRDGLVAVEHDATTHLSPFCVSALYYSLRHPDRITAQFSPDPLHPARFYNDGNLVAILMPVRNPV